MLFVVHCHLSKVLLFVCLEVSSGSEEGGETTDEAGFRRRGKLLNVVCAKSKVSLSEQAACLSVLWLTLDICFCISGTVWAVY